MTFYSIMNFVHVVGSVGIIVAIMFEGLMMRKLLRTNGPDQFAVWRDIYKLPTQIGAPSVIISLLTGIYLAVVAWPQSEWVWLSVVALIAVAIIGATLTRSAQKVLVRANSTRDVGPTWSKLWLSLQLRTGLIVGILFLMVVKPTLGPSLFALIFFTAVFSLPVAFFWRKYEPLRRREV